MTVGTCNATISCLKVNMNQASELHLRCTCMTLSISQNHPLLLTLPPLALAPPEPPLPPPPPPPPLPSSTDFSPLALPVVFPAIQAATSKFCSGFAALAPPLRILFFCCSSNSFFISGSTMHTIPVSIGCCMRRWQSKGRG